MRCVLVLLGRAVGVNWRNRVAFIAVPVFPPKPSKGLLVLQIQLNVICTYTYSSVYVCVAVGVHISLKWNKA